MRFLLLVLLRYEVPLGAGNTVSLQLSEIIQRLVEKVEVVCPVPKVTGRGRRSIKFPPLREYALENSIPIYDAPAKVFSPFHDWTLPKQVAMTFNLGVVVSFGYFLPPELISSFPDGAINMHPSLLPKYRGAAPIQHALINGDSMTGVSIIEVHPQRFDVGRILCQAKLDMPSSIKYLELKDMLASLGAQQLVYTLQYFEELKKSARSQASTETELQARKIREEDTYVRWHKMSNFEVYNLWRGLGETRGIYTYLRERRVRLIRVRPVSCFAIAEKSLRTGQIVIKANRILVKCCEGLIECMTLKPDGKKEIDSDSFINGYLAPLPTREQKFHSSM